MHKVPMHRIRDDGKILKAGLMLYLDFQEMKKGRFTNEDDKLKHAVNGLLEWPCNQWNFTDEKVKLALDCSVDSNKN